MAFQSGLHQGTYRGSAVTKNTADTFIPEMWSSEVKRERDLSFVLSKYVKSLSGQFSKGDRINVPMVSRAAVNKKLPETPVQLQARTEGNFFMDIDQYNESSFMIEDLVGIQSSYNLRGEYTKEAGYALARDVDNYLLALRAVILGAQVGANATYTLGVNSAAATQNIVSVSSGTIAAPLNYTAILRAKMRLDASSVPASDRVLVVNTTGYNQLLAVDKFISMDYQNGAPVTNGVVGTIFGIPVIMTTNMNANTNNGYFNGSGAVGQPTPGVTGSPYLPSQDLFVPLPITWGSIAGTTYAAQSGQGASEVHTAIMCHKDWAVMAMQKSPSVEASRETLYLADAVVMSQVYGGRVFRPDHAVNIFHDGTLPSVN